MQYEVVLTAELRPGDIILSYERGKSREVATEILLNDNTHYFRYEVVGIINGCWAGHSLALDLKTRVIFSESIVHVNDLVFFKIVARSQANRPSTQFPHLCPRCGAKAYVGFISVQHEVKAQCPAE